MKSSQEPSPYQRPSLFNRILNSFPPFRISHSPTPSWYIPIRVGHTFPLFSLFLFLLQVCAELALACSQRCGSFIKSPLLESLSRNFCPYLHCILPHCRVVLYSHAGLYVPPTMFIVMAVGKALPFFDEVPVSERDFLWKIATLRSGPVVFFTPHEKMMGRGCPRPLLASSFIPFFRNAWFSLALSAGTSFFPQPLCLQRPSRPVHPAHPLFPPSFFSGILLSVCSLLPNTSSHFHPAGN